MTQTDIEQDEFAEYDFEGTEGAEVAEERMKAARSARGEQVPYLKLDDKERVLVRFVNDIRRPKGRPVTPHSPVAWMTVQTHGQVPTKPRKTKGDDGKETIKTGSMSAVCRKDRLVQAKFPQGCWIDQNVLETEGKYKGKPVRASEKTFALVIMREPVYGTEEMAARGEIPENKVGRLIYARDAYREVKLTDSEGNETGEVKKIPDVRLVNFGWKNFFGIVMGIGDNEGTVVDRDFWVTRSGSGTDTTYKVGPVDPFTIRHPLDVKRAAEGEIPESDIREVRYDLGDPEIVEHRFEGSLPDLRRIVIRMASDDYYNHFFIPGEGDDKAPAGGVVTPDEPDVEQPGEALDRLRRRAVPMDEPVAQPAPPQPATDQADLSALAERAKSMGTAPTKEQVEQALAASDAPAASPVKRSSLLD